MAPLFSPEALAALTTPGVTERWTAVQERLHPLLAALAEQVRAAALRRYPRQWPLYEISFKSQRYLHRVEVNAIRSKTTGSPSTGRHAAPGCWWP
ncbi:MAG: hypothetical protein SNJ69_02225 [Chloroflexaceae bacterium]